MRRPNEQVLNSIAKISKQFPDVVAWVQEWRTAELDQLPMVTGSTGVAQGRCQVLMELLRLLNEAPDKAGQAPPARNIAYH